jgi:hypothetical protein
MQKIIQAIGDYMPLPSESKFQETGRLLPDDVYHETNCSL